MTNVQKENGFTPVAHELLEAIRSADFNATELKILIDVLDRTYGYGKQTAWFSGGYVANHLGLNERGARRAVEALVARRVLVKRLIIDGPSRQRHLGINKHYDQWAATFAPAFAKKAAEKFSVSVPAGVTKRFSKNATASEVGAAQPGVGVSTPPHVGAGTPPKQEDIKEELVVVDARARETNRPDIHVIPADIVEAITAQIGFGWSAEIARLVAALVVRHGDDNFRRAMEDATIHLVRRDSLLAYVRSTLMNQEQNGYLWDSASSRRAARATPAVVLADGATSDGQYTFDT